MVPATATPEPSQTLAPAARTLWRLEGGVGTLLALVPAILVQVFAGGLWALLVWIAFALFALFAVVLVPELRWRRWRWEVREHEIDLRHGTWEVIRTLVPMARVHHVTTRRGPVPAGTRSRHGRRPYRRGRERDPRADGRRGRARARPDRRAGPDAR